jgi:hypothetical protein
MPAIVRLPQDTVKKKGSARATVTPPPNASGWGSGSRRGPTTSSCASTMANRGGRATLPLALLTYHPDRRRTTRSKASG